MARPLSELSRDILTYLTEVGSYYARIADAPLWDRRAFSRWCWEEMKRSDLPYDRRFYQTVWRLEQRGYIQRSSSQVELSPEARRSLKEIEFDQHTLQTPPWDGIWRIIIWDVPEEQRVLRNRMRRTLKRLKFAQIQGSVWVTPHPCRDEISWLRTEIGLDRGVLYLESTVIEGQQRLIEHFELQK